MAEVSLKKDSLTNRDDLKESPLQEYPELETCPVYQKFLEFKQKCLEEKKYFVDDDFPKSKESLVTSSSWKHASANIRWLRPKDIVSKPRFLQGATKYDIVQGSLGNCWLLAGLSCIVQNEFLFTRVVPPNQHFKHNYAGIFYFRFWQYGEWVGIYVDDYLPTVDKKLIFMRSVNRNEFWSSLIEKAYAKLHGSYESIQSGRVSDSLTDLTGGLAMEISVPKMADCSRLTGKLLKDLQHINELSETRLFKYVKKLIKRGAFCGCGTPSSDEKYTINGLASSHAYSISKAVKVTKKNGDNVRLFCVRNPWGKVKWKGRYCENSREWVSISSQEIYRIGMVFQAEGDFWITVSDFLLEFLWLYVCDLTPFCALKDNFETESKKQWSKFSTRCEWPRGNSVDAFPWYILQVKKRNDDKTKQQVIVALMQIGRRLAKHKGQQYFKISLAAYNVEAVVKEQLIYDELSRMWTEQGRNLAKRRWNAVRITFEQFLKENWDTITVSPSLIEQTMMGWIRRNGIKDNVCLLAIEHSELIQSLPKYRHHERILRMNLNPGYYLIIPLAKNAEGEFYLRFFCEKDGLTVSDDNGQNKNTKNEQDGKLFFIDPDYMEKVPEEVKKEFLEATDGKEKMYVEQLQIILNKRFSQLSGDVKQVFPIEICKSILAIADKNQSGYLDRVEYKNVHKNLKTWTQAFESFKENEKPYMYGKSLKNALNSAKLRTTDHNFEIMLFRYGTEFSADDHLEHSSQEDNRFITFVNFVLICVKLKYAIKRWNTQYMDKHRSQIYPVFTLDEFVRAVMYS